MYMYMYVLSRVTIRTEQSEFGCSKCLRAVMVEASLPAINLAGSPLFEVVPIRTGRERARGRDFGSVRGGTYPPLFLPFYLIFISNLFVYRNSVCHLSLDLNSVDNVSHMIIT